MKKVIKAPIIFSLLAASAFSIVGLEPSIAGNKELRWVGKCRVMKVGKGDYRIKRNANLIWKGTSFYGAWAAFHDRGRLNACDAPNNYFPYKMWGSGGN